MVKVLEGCRKKLTLFPTVTMLECPLHGGCTGNRLSPRPPESWLGEEGVMRPVAARFHHLCLPQDYLWEPTITQEGFKSLKVFS